MKIILRTLYLVLLFSIISFSQYGISGTADSKKMLNPDNSIWEMVLRNQHKEFYEEGFNPKDTRTTINKTLLENGFLLKESIFQRWWGTLWMNDSKCSYTYDENNNLIEELDQNWNPVYGWMNYWKYSYAFDVNYYLVEKLTQRWDSYYFVWVNAVKYTYTYDVNYNLTEELEECWYYSYPYYFWEYVYKYTYTYDIDNNLIEVLMQHWDPNWVNKSKSTYTYDAYSNLIEKLTQIWESSHWVNEGKCSNTYDVNNNLIEELCQHWDGSVWVNTDKSLYTYDVNNNLIEELRQDWDGSVWVNIYKWLNTYDVNNNLIEKLWQDWHVSNWVSEFKYSYTYDVNNNMIEELEQQWDGYTWVNMYRNIHSYILTGLEQFDGEVGTYSLSNNYPNPFNPSSKIKYQIPELSFITLKVFDILGNEIETLVQEEKPTGTYEVTWYPANLPSGVYFYQLKAVDPSTGSGQAFIQTRKMILLK